MTTTDASMDNRISVAQRKIAAILAALETDTGQIVKDLTLCSVDVTNLRDTEVQHGMHVVITLERLPGHQWGV